MKNLHKISDGIPEFVRLVATRWHLTDTNYIGRRVGILNWDGIYLYYHSWGEGPRTNKVADSTKFLGTDMGKEFKRYFDVRKSVTVDYFQVDMIKKI